MDFQRHKQGIGLQPCNAALDKVLIGTVRDKTAVGCAQNGKAGIKQAAVVHTFAVKALLCQLRFGQKPLSCQNLQIDKIRIAGSGGRGLIRTVAIGCGV